MPIRPNAILFMLEIRHVHQMEFSPHTMSPTRPCCPTHTFSGSDYCPILEERGACIFVVHTIGNATCSGGRVMYQLGVNSSIGRELRVTNRAPVYRGGAVLLRSQIESGTIFEAPIISRFRTKTMFPPQKPGPLPGDQITRRGWHTSTAPPLLPLRNLKIYLLSI